MNAMVALEKQKQLENEKMEQDFRRTQDDAEARGVVHIETTT